MNEIKIDKNYKEEFIDFLRSIKASQNNGLKSVNIELITFIGRLMNILVVYWRYISGIFVVYW